MKASRLLLLILPALLAALVLTSCVGGPGRSRPPAPRPGAVWMDGHYSPSGRWVPGHWK